MVDERPVRWPRVQVGRAQGRSIFSWSDSFCWSRDRILDVETELGNVFGADGVDAYHQAPEYEEVVVEPAPEYLERLAKAGRDRHCVAVATSAAQKTSSRSELGGTLGGESCEQTRLCAVQDSTPVLLDCSATSCIGIALGQHNIETQVTAAFVQ